ncbi:MAG: sigma-70 family RNA polymerase sigma factor [Akkermansiaceae bacterium]
MSNSNYARLITENQQKIYGYIYSLMGSNASSWDVLQESNIVLWQKESEFQMGTNFQAWAFSIARFQVLAFLRDRQREPLDILTPELVEAFADDAVVESEKHTTRLQALKHCRAQLQEKHSHLLQLYYENEMSIQSISERIGQSANAIKQSLLRIRRKLQNCIDLKLQDKMS